MLTIKNMTVGSMKDLSEILDNAKDGIKPSYDECYYAMLVLHSLLAQEHSTTCEMANPNCKIRPVLLKQARSRIVQANVSDPQEYLGDNVPGNKRYDSLRRFTKAIGKKLFGEK